MIRRLLAARDLTKEGIARSFSRVHFVGIGGAGMSGIAEVLCTLGYRVSGSDTADSATTRRLAGLGVTVHRGHGRDRQIPQGRPHIPGKADPTSGERPRGGTELGQISAGAEGRPRTADQQSLGFRVVVERGEHLVEVIAHLHRVGIQRLWPGEHDAGNLALGCVAERGQLRRPFAHRLSTHRILSSSASGRATSSSCPRVMVSALPAARARSAAAAARAPVRGSVNGTGAQLGRPWSSMRPSPATTGRTPRRRYHPQPGPLCPEK